MKKEGARLKAIRDRAWRHLGMISAAKLEENYEKSKSHQASEDSLSARPSLIRLGPHPNPQQQNEQNDSKKFELQSLGYTQSQQMLEFINLVKHRDDMLHVVALKVLLLFFFFQMIIYNFVFLGLFSVAGA